MLNITLLTLIPLITLFLLELIYRGSINLTLSWIYYFPNQFLISYAILFGLINTLYILPRKIYGAFGILIAALFSIAGFINHQKLVIRGEPLLPWDFRLGREALNIFQNFEGFPFSGTSILLQFAILAAIILMVILIFFFIVPREKYSVPKKLLPACLSFTLFFILTHVISLEKTFSLQLINWSQKANFEENGMFLGFYLNSQYLSVEKPNFYEEENINTILGQHVSSCPFDHNFSPNIIIVMSEAFWDPTVLQGVSFSEDPLPYFHFLQKKHTSGVLLTPVYGGGTANTEFEILTGFSTRFLPRGMIPYAQLVHKPIEALPAILNRQGYETTAIHTYDDWFYRRNSIYQYLGFNRFISKNSFINPEYSGSYIRDTELSRKIINVVKQTAEPDFVFALSMQAHGPYLSEKNLENTIQVSSNLEPETQVLLENYTNILADVDISVKLLIEGLEEINEPSMVVFFGDHLPMLGNNFDVYRETCYFNDENSYSDYLNKYCVPILVWDNFSGTIESLRLSSSFLSSYILASSMNKGSLLTDFLYNLSENGSNFLSAIHYLQYENITEEKLAEYQLLQYDLLIGNEYAYKLCPSHKPFLNPLYTLDNDPDLSKKCL
jgi:phosphoglycerol transferase MdoB-like AlkP superfamily enzyme